ncbi:type II RES/Xre toxin-antitoxin system antitoxin [Pantoea sp. C2G6]|uniref:type II RES/Xre toxin-antitoxin system antitoxin n=1 Tax=Pantoea sp. C2G6 TaxID=3243084 RepID=UPI003ED989C0
MSIAIYTPGPHRHDPSLLHALNLPETLSDAHQRIALGFSSGVLKRTASLSAFDEAWLCRLAGIDRTTYNRKVKDPQQTFSPDQSGRIYMLIRVLSAASKLFRDDRQRLAQWLETPAKALGGRKPAEMTTTVAGAEAVINLIGQLEHGVIT